MADIYIGNVKGPQGETGATGAQGPQGDAATIEVGTVSTTAYGNTAQVINTGTSSEAVFDFVIPQGRPGEETTTMSSLTLDTVTAQSTQYPVPATGESGSVVFGKIIKFFNDIKTAVNSKINISDIVNNLTSTATNKPLSSAQGKALNDALTSFGWWHLANAQAAPQTATTYSTVQNRKFSDYDLLTINYVDANGTYVRAGVIVPATLFASTSVLLSNNDGSNNNHNVEVKRISDTSYSLLASANSIGYKVSIQGIKISK